MNPSGEAMRDELKDAWDEIVKCASDPTFQNSRAGLILAASMIERRRQRRASTAADPVRTAGQALVTQLSAVIDRLGQGQAYSSTLSAMNGFKAVLDRAAPQPLSNPLGSRTRDALGHLKEARELLALAYKGGSYKSKINSAIWRLTYAERALSLPAEGGAREGNEIERLREFARYIIAEGDHVSRWVLGDKAREAPAVTRPHQSTPETK